MKLNILGEWWLSALFYYAVCIQLWLSESQRRQYT